MPVRVLLDTGPLVALLDRSERMHEPCTEWISQFRGTLLTTEAVVTEACHMVRRLPGGPARCVEAALRPGIGLVQLEMEHHLRILRLITKYADTPMDYADATLVAVGEALGVRTVFTLDRKRFTAYRAFDREAFEIVPGE